VIIQTFKCISMYQPWATWLVLGWKSIETRTHPKLRCLVGKRVLIHAAKRYDPFALLAARPYLTEEQFHLSLNFSDSPRGFIIGSALAFDFQALGREHEKGALIECETRRFGLFFDSPRPITPIFYRGHQGIFNVEMDVTKVMP
jgi:hypothetical protein